MMKTLALLMRGAIADNAQAIHDANAVAILRQQIRDAAGALAPARRELAVAMAYQAAEVRALDANVPGSMQNGCAHGVLRVFRRLEGGKCNPMGRALQGETASAALRKGLRVPIMPWLSVWGR